VKKLFVGGLPFESGDEDLRTLFDGFNVASATVIKDKFTGRSKGFGFVELDDAQMDDAVAKLNGSSMQGRKLTVNEARPMVKRSSGDFGGGRGGGRGGDRGGFGGKRW